MKKITFKIETQVPYSTIIVSEEDCFDIDNVWSSDGRAARMIMIAINDRVNRRVEEIMKDAAIVLDKEGLRKVFRCSAMQSKSVSYPERFNGLVPRTVKLLKNVKSDWHSPFLMHQPAGQAGKFYPCMTNSHGAVSIVVGESELLGVKPDEFEVVEFYGAEDLK